MSQMLVEKNAVTKSEGIECKEYIRCTEKYIRCTEEYIRCNEEYIRCTEEYIRWHVNYTSDRTKHMSNSPNLRSERVHNYSDIVLAVTIKSNELSESL